MAQSETSRNMLSNDTKMAMLRWMVVELRAVEQIANYGVFYVLRATSCSLTNYYLDVHLWQNNL